MEIEQLLGQGYTAYYTSTEVRLVKLPRGEKGPAIQVCQHRRVVCLSTDQHATLSRTRRDEPTSGIDAWRRAAVGRGNFVIQRKIIICPSRGGGSPPKQAAPAVGLAWVSAFDFDEEFSEEDANM